MKLNHEDAKAWATEITTRKTTDPHDRNLAACYIDLLDKAKDVLYDSQIRSDSWLPGKAKEERIALEKIVGSI